MNVNSTDLNWMYFEIPYNYPMVNLHVIFPTAQPKIAVASPSPPPGSAVRPPANRRPLGRQPQRVSPAASASP